MEQTIKIKSYGRSGTLTRSETLRGVAVIKGASNGIILAECVIPSLPGDFATHAFALELRGHIEIEAA